jgi:hypothetical protein
VILCFLLSAGCCVVVIGLDMMLLFSLSTQYNLPDSNNIATDLMVLRRFFIYGLPSSDRRWDFWNVKDPEGNTGMYFVRHGKNSIKLFEDVLNTAQR